SVPVTLPAGTPLAAVDYDELPSDCNFVIPPKLEDDVAFVLDVAGYMQRLPNEQTFSNETLLCMMQGSTPIPMDTPQRVIRQGLSNKH
ncbi:hypothetical protein HDU96_004347, partial [Phlyctochytrium bullatum]